MFLPSRLFASDGLPRPQDGSKISQESSKRGPGGLQDSPKSAQERPKSVPRGPQEAIFRAPDGSPQGPQGNLPGHRFWMGWWGYAKRWDFLPKPLVSETCSTYSSSNT